MRVSSPSSSLIWEAVYNIPYVAGLFLIFLDFRNFLANFTENPESLKSLWDVISYTRTEPKERCPEFGMVRLVKADYCEHFLPPGSDGYKSSQQVQERISGLFKNLLKETRCDLIAYPLSPKINMWPFAGYPHTAIPLPAFPQSTRIFGSLGHKVDDGPNIP